MKEKKLLSILRILCLILGVSGFITLTVFADQVINIIDQDTTWFVGERDSGGYKWVSKPTGDHTAQTADVKLGRHSNYGEGDIVREGIEATKLNNNAKLTMELPKEMPTSPMASHAPELLFSISNGEGSGSVEIVEPKETASGQSSGNATELCIYGANGSDGGNGGAAIELSGGLTVDVNEHCKIEITGGKGGDGDYGGDGGNGGTGVDGDVTLAGGTLTIAGGKGGEGIMGGAGGKGVNGDVRLTGGTLNIYGGDGSYGTENGYGGAGVTGTVTLAGGTLTVQGGMGGGDLGCAPAFAEGSRVIIESGFAYTDGTTTYPAGTYETNDDFNLNDTFGGKRLMLCEARIGDVFYRTLQAAFDAAKNGETITLLRDIEQKATLDVCHATSLSLDLNGMKLLFNGGEGSSFNSGDDIIRYFMYDENHIITIAGSGTIEVKGRNASGNATTSLWRFCRDDAAGTGTLTVLDDAAMDNVEDIDTRPWAAFRSSITAAALDEGVTCVNSGAFMECSALESVTIPSTITRIADNSMPAGVTLYTPCADTDTGVPEAVDVYIGKNGGTCDVIHNYVDGVCRRCWRFSDIEPDVLYLPADLKTIDKQAFMGSACQVVIVPDGCTHIGSGAFAECPNLVFARVPVGTTIAEDAFAESVHIKRIGK